MNSCELSGSVDVSQQHSQQNAEKFYSVDSVSNLSSLIGADRKSRAGRSHLTGLETEGPPAVLTNTDSPSQPRPQSFHLAMFSSVCLPWLSCTHKLSINCSHRQALKLALEDRRTCWPMEELHSAAMILQQCWTMTELDLLWWRNRAISSRIPSLTRINWELKEGQVTVGLLAFIISLADILWWMTWPYVVRRMCRQDRQQRQSRLWRRGFHQGFQRHHAVKLHQLILYRTCTCRN